MFERPPTGQAAVIVHLAFGIDEYDEADREFRELVESAGADVLDHIGGSRRTPDPRYFVGGGKVDEIAESAKERGAELVVFNHDLSPSQERNLEKRLNARVLDRAGLILDIFASRARSHEGKLQVELAQLQHLATRLVRGWSHLERQKGGIGLRGTLKCQVAGKDGTPVEGVMVFDDGEVRTTTAPGMATFWPIISVSSERSVISTATRWRSLISAKSLSLAR